MGRKFYFPRGLDLLQNINTSQWMGYIGIRRGFINNQWASRHACWSNANYNIRIANFLDRLKFNFNQRQQSPGVFIVRFQFVRYFDYLLNKLTLCFRLLVLQTIRHIILNVYRRIDA